MANHSRLRRNRHAFTLVEMLTVIIIIGILAGLLSGAVIRARVRAKITVQKIEIEQLSMAMEAYRQKYGEYPPCNIPADADSVRRHLRKAFPRYNIGRVATGNTDPYAQFTADLAVYGLNVAYMDAASALVFWLGGLPETIPGANEPWAPAGFHADPTNPFQAGTSRLPRFYEFQPDSTRLFLNSDGALRFTPPGVTTAPYVYFRARRDANTNRYEYGYALPLNNPTYFQPYACAGGDNNVCVPYMDWQDGDPLPTDGSVAAATPANTAYRRWRNPETFQILSPGLDGYYGHGGSTTFAASNPYWYRYSRILVNLSPEGADRDNIANFSDGTLADEARNE